MCVDGGETVARMFQKVRDDSASLNNWALSILLMYLTEILLKTRGLTDQFGDQPISKLINIDDTETIFFCHVDIQITDLDLDML